MPTRSTEKEVVQASVIDPRRVAAVKSLTDLLGLPYLWPCKENGYLGKHPDDGGMDCSGAANWARYKAGVAPMSDGRKYNAHDLWKRLVPVAARDTEIGDLVFYGTVKKVNHVMVLIGTGQCVGEVGGSPRCYSAEISKKLGASMKIRPVTYRRDVVGYGRLL